MKSCDFHARHRHQRGAILLMMAAAMIMLASWLAYQLLSAGKHASERDRASDVSRALAQAKENLLAFAVSEPEIYGYDNLGPKAAQNVPGVGHFPCPDFNADGAPDGNNCNASAVTVIGRVPHDQAPSAINGNMDYFLFSADMAPGQGDGAGAYSIWYAVSGAAGMMPDFRTVNQGLLPRKEPLNSTVVQGLSAMACGNGVLCVDGTPVVAVLVAAGVPLAGQDRSAGVYGGFLDMANGDNDPWNLISRFPVGQVCAADAARPELCFNDRVLTITVNDWVGATEARVRSSLDWQGDADTDGTINCRDADWLTANAAHWAIRNQWQTVSNICP